MGHLLKTFEKEKLNLFRQFMNVNMALWGVTWLLKGALVYVTWLNSSVLQYNVTWLMSVDLLLHEVSNFFTSNTYKNLFWF